ncbi:transglycosylase domain-containing protein [Streptomyces sp. ISL-100]|uniref:transglycosylase domain-containing protein n=1 Tax=Streptomyces sp. ISL-100 TaxID=2819173 RepID=UPI001BE590F4|nr:transglycosylase domain-containing protein [Streptomyces sp. ISL-100]MBT2395556.1 transglycosylase domain-containing protein [Streptomyces sp. ISL-100]
MSDEPQQPQGWAPRDPSDPSARPATRPATRKGQGNTEGQSKVKRKRTGLRRLIPTWRMVLGTFLLIALLVIGAFLAGYTLVKIPAANSAATAQSNVYLYADGSQLARDGEVNREKVKLAQVPKTVQHAVLAAEDRDFYSERAVDPQAMLRAGWNTVTGKGKQSGSTITQQYVKNYYLGQEQTVTRKVKEFFIAIKLDREESKNDIFEGYLNTSYFGRNAYGIQAAAQAYYGKDIDDVTTGEGAYLASLLNAPSAYDITTHPENKGAALGRWNYVLDGMVKEDWLSAADRAAVKFPAPHEAKPASSLSGQRGYIVQAVGDYLTKNKIIDEGTLATGGYRITTTLEKSKQDAFAQAVDDKVTSQTSKDRKADRNVRVGGASIDPATGKVVAMYGGIDYTKQYVNNATRRDYQVGSTFKPFVFTSAVENGSTTQDGRQITPNTVYDGTNKRMVEGPNGPTGYAPENEDQRSYGQVPVRTATDKSINAVYAQMAQDVGPAKVKDTAVALGIPEHTPSLDAYPSIALGVATASVLDMTQAYATLANHGKHGTYTIVEKITKDGQIINLPKAEAGSGTGSDSSSGSGTGSGSGSGSDARQGVSREAADTTTSILRSVVDGGTGTAAQSAGRPAAGKTGTAEEDRAAWFAGYTPDLATVVAVMGQDPETGVQKPLYGALGQPRINGGGAPAQIWGQFTAAALEGKPVQDFDLEMAAGSEEPADSPSEGEPDTGESEGSDGSDEPSASENPDDDPPRSPSDGGPTDTGGATDTGGTTGSPGTDGGTADTGGTGGTGGTADTGGATDTGGTADTGGTTGATDGGTTDGGTTDTGGTTGPPSDGLLSGVRGRSTSG